MSAIKRLVIFASILSILGISDAFAGTKQTGDWKIVTGKHDGENFCYAYTTPYRTKAYDGLNRSKPYIVFANKGKNSVSLGVDTGFVIDANQGVTLSVNGEIHLLDVKLNKNAWTYTATQDVSIIDDLIQSDGNVEVRSYDLDGKTAVDYYSLKGILHVLRDLKTNCQGIQTVSK